MEAKIKKDWYGRSKTTEELHDDSKYWLSEIDFVNDEIRFLDHLLGSNYIDFLEYNLDKNVKRLVQQINDEKSRGVALRKVINDHENILDDLISTKSVTSNLNYIEAHKDLELEMTIYMKKYKKVKRQIFEIVEGVMKKKGQKKLMKQ